MRRPVIAWLLRLLLALMLALPAMAAAGGSVTVVNRTVIPLRIVDLEEHSLAQVGPARSYLLALPAGRIALKAFRLDGSLYREATITVKPKGTVVWEILPIEAVLDVRNTSTKDVVVEIDGQPLLELKAGQTSRVDGIRPGSRWLRAVMADGGVVASRVAELAPQDTFVWELEQSANPAAGIPVVRVRNFSGQPVKVFVNGRERIALRPAETAALVGIAPGPLKLEAKSMKSAKVVASHAVDIGAGQELVWDVPAPDGLKAVVEVRNQTAGLLKVCVDGSFCLMVRKQSSIQYDALTAGRHTFQAYELETDRLLEALEADLQAGTPYVWEVGPAR